MYWIELKVSLAHILYYKYYAAYMTIYSLMGVVKVMWPIFVNFAPPPILSLELVKFKRGILNTVCWLILRSTSLCITDYSRDLFKFWEISDNISDTVQDKVIVATEV